MTELVRSARCEADLQRFRRLRSLPAGSREHAELRAELICAHLPLVHRIAGGFDRRTASFDELVQVGCEALVRAVDHFDPDRGNGFMTYAYPCICGAIKRYFRDFTWTIRPSRPVQELWVEIKRARPTLTQRLGHPPTPRELAGELGVPVTDIDQAMDVYEGCTALSLDAQTQDEDDQALYDRLGATDPDITLIDNRISLWPALNRLPERDRTIVLMRYYGNHTQREIAATLGLSQMHVSRLLRSAREKLRQALLA